MSEQGTGVERVPAARWVPAFAVLFLFYQLPEGLGARLLHQPGTAALLMLAFLPVAWAVARWLGLSMAQGYALEWSRRNGGWLVAGLALALATKALAVWVGLQQGIYTTAGTSTPTAEAAAIAGTLAWLALSTFVPSLAEDIVARGFWWRVPGWSWSGPRLVVFTAVLYVLNHVYRLGAGPAEWLMLLCFGLAYGAALWRTGSLWAAVGLHWGWNFAGPALDLAWPVELADATLARYLSGAAHLLMLLVVLAAWRSRADVKVVESGPASSAPPDLR